MKSIERFRALAMIGAAFVLLSGEWCPGDVTEPTPVSEGQKVVRIDPAFPNLTGWVGVSDSTEVFPKAQDPNSPVTNPTLITLSGTKMKWSSSNTAIVQIINDDHATTSTPRFKFMGAGSASIIGTMDDSRLALASGFDGSVSVSMTVTEPPTRLTLAPRGGTIVIGQTLSMSGAYFTAAGTPAAAALSYIGFTCVDPAACQRGIAPDAPGQIVNIPDGITLPGAGFSVKGLAAGTVKVIANLNQLIIGGIKTLARDTVTVTVIAPVVPAKITVDPLAASAFVGGTKQFNATVLDASNNSLPVSVLWTISNANLATVNGSGLATALSTGNLDSVSAVVQVIAKTNDGTVQGSSSLTIYKQISNVLVQPNPKSIQTGTTQQFTATLRDNNGKTIPPVASPISWSVGSNTIADISSTGVVTAKAVGTTTVTAKTAEGLAGTADLTVTAPPVTVKTVVVDPTPFTMEVGFTHHFTVTLKDASGATLPPTFTTITWSTENNSVATVDQSGNVTSKAVGTTRVVATTAEGIPGYSDLTVINSTAPVIVRVDVSPAKITLKLSDVQCQFTAKAFDANGNQVIVEGFRWLIDDSNVSRLDSDGLATFKNAGKTTIRAFYGNAADAPGGSAELTVTSN